jgi:hypothetical protein
MINDSFKSPVIPEFQVRSFLDTSRNDVSQDQRELQESSLTSANNSFFSNLKAAVKSHAVSPTKRYGIFSSSHENANANANATSTLKTQQSTQSQLKLQPQTQRRRSNSGGGIVKEGTKLAIIKKRSFIFDSTSISANANSLFSSKDDDTMKESSAESKRTNLVGSTFGEKKDRKLSSSPRLFATLAAKFSSGRGGSGFIYSPTQFE